MKKRLLMILTVAMLVFGVAVVVPNEEVKANAYTDMNYDQVVAFWSSQAAFQTIFVQEAMLSPYEWGVKTDITRYFKASLTDYCLNPNNLNNRPYTKAYMAGVIANSNPYIYQEIVCGDHAFTLQEKLLDEMNQIAPYLSYNDKCENVSILTSFLNHQGVYTVDQYNNWKNNNGGKTAFEVYCHQINDASDAWTNAIKAASAAQNAQLQQIGQDAYEQQQQMEAQMSQQMQDAMQQQQDMMNQMMGNN